MKFENISTEEDFREGRIRMAVLWEKEDVGRFSDFFKQDMVDVVQIISAEGVVGAIVTPQLPSEPASTDDVRISATELKRRLQYEYDRESSACEAGAACAYRGALQIVDEMIGRETSIHPPQSPGHEEPLRADGSCVNCGETGSHSFHCWWWRRYGSRRQVQTGVSDD